jgi:CRP-like cAMP-binding protein
LILHEGCNTLAPKTYLCRKGDPSDMIYVLLTGSIEALAEDGTLIHTFQDDNKQAFSLLVCNTDMSELPSEIFDNLTFLGEIGCLLNTPRTLTLRVGKSECIIFCISGKSSAFENLFLFNSGFRMNLAHNVATYVKQTNTKILDERHLIQDTIRKIAQYQERSERIVSTLENALEKCSYLDPSYETIKSILADYRRYDQIEPMIQNSLEAISLVEHFDNMADSAPVFYKNSGHATENGDFVTVSFNEGEIICCQNEESDDIFFLMDGAVEVIIYDQVIEIIDRPGTFIGEISVLLGFRNTSRLTRTATMRALIPTRLAVKKGSHFINSVKHKPQIIKILFKSLTEKLQSSDRTLNDILKKSRNIRALLNDFKGPKILIRRLATAASRSKEFMKYLTPLLDPEELENLQ